MIILGSPFGFAPGTMQSAIERLGLTSGLKLCLDASDINSYSGSGQSWLDTSGNGYDFFRGTTSASQATDPTFNGVAGAQSSSEYWSFDGGDYFTYDSANETWMNNLHKNNATFTIAMWFRLASLPGSSQGLAGAYAATSPPTDIGWEVNVGSASLFGFTAYSGGAVARSVFTTGAVSAAQWLFGVISVDEAAGTGFVQVNSTQEAKTTTYTSPSASNANATMRIGDGGDGAAPIASGGRIASTAVWEGISITTAQALTLFEATRAKFGV